MKTNLFNFCSVCQGDVYVVPDISQWSQERLEKEAEAILNSPDHGSSNLVLNGDGENCEISFDDPSKHTANSRCTFQCSHKTKVSLFMIYIYICVCVYMCIYVFIYVYIV